jgi:hypothetical protein
MQEQQLGHAVCDGANSKALRPGSGMCARMPVVERTGTA